MFVLILYDNLNHIETDFPFLDDNTAFCGNNIVEDGEECDCGYDEDCTDQCCVGRQSDGSGCVLMAGKQCR